MGRRAKPPKKNAEAKRPLAGKTPKDGGAKVRDLEQRLAEALKLQAEAQELQRATSEILRVISRSSTDVQPVFDAIVRHAVRLCGGVTGNVWGLRDHTLELVASHNVDERLLAIARETGHRRGLDRSLLAGRAILDRAVVNVPDVSSDPEYEPELARHFPRGALSVPMLKDGVPIGAITVTRPLLGLFSEEHIALLETFADQAVIAIENVRLFTELEARNRELTTTLEQQTATSELLKVIGRSSFDLQPVFETLAENAGRLCKAERGFVHRFDGRVLRIVAGHNMSPDLRTFVEQNPIPPGRHSIAGRAALERRTIHILDAQADLELTYGGLAVGDPVRTMLAVPMLRTDELLGVIMIYRLEVLPFTDSQIALMETFADQAVIAIENVRLFTELQASNRELTTALDTQTATSDILRVISRSQTDVQPVFETILASAVRLLGAFSGSLTRRAGDQIELVALTSTDDAGDAAVRARYPQPLQSEDFQARALRDGAPLIIADAQTDPRLPEATRAYARARGWRSAVMVPMLRHGEAVGTISVTRRDPGGFTDDEIALLQTFADQAVIAVENVRLFKELEARNVELVQSLDRQTATAEILRAISQSPTDTRPVFETIARNGVRVIGAGGCTVFVVVGDQLHLVAMDIDSPAWAAQVGPLYPAPIDADLPTTQAVRERRVVHLSDIEHNPEVRPKTRQVSLAGGYRTVVFVPMLRGDVAVGAVGVARTDPAPFSDRQVELLQTFAAQAVIAIENVRLFTELQASNRELTTALDTQTATSDILRVISRSQTNVQPVFDAIVASAVRLLGAYTGALTQIAGDQIELAALTSTDDAGDAATRARFPQSLQSEGSNAQAIRDRAPINIADAQTDPRTPEAGRATARARGYRSQVVVPLLRHDEAVGTIAVTRREPGGFTDDEIALLQTFADQAVIAIENARLLSELQARTQELTRSVEQLTALGDVGRAVSSSLDLDTVLTTIVGRAVQLSGTDGGTIFEYDEGAEEFSPRATLNADESQSALLRATRLRRGEGAVGQMAVTREPLQIPDIAAEGAYEGRLRGALLEAGTRAVLAVPLLHEERIVGGLVVTRRSPGAFTTEIVEILRTFATQSALAIQNARLFREIERKSLELEVASQHKSEFLASMSHELRTPLNAIIGYSELLEEDAEDLDGGRLVPDLHKIAVAAKHQLSLINDILDLSKVEAGRMELERSAFDLGAAIDDAMLLMRERASRRGITLERHVDGGVGAIRADERKVKQVLLNLLSNAVKFTPAGGRIEVRAGIADGDAEIAVTDTGSGIAPEDHDAVFEEFRQVGTAEKKAEGTGLGLALCRKFVELHGGRIWVRSQVGEGSTFTFTLPVRSEKEMGA